MAKTSKPAAVADPQRPYLKSVHLRNYRSLRDVEASFKPGLNIIIGKNGSGKTNFLGLVGELVTPFSEKLTGAGCEIEVGGKVDVSLKFNKSAKQSPKLQNGLPFQLAEQPLSIVATVNGVPHTTSTVGGAIDLAIGYEHYPTYSVVLVHHGLPNYALPILDATADLSISPETLTLNLINSDKSWQRVAQDNELVAMLFIRIIDLGRREHNTGNAATYRAKIVRLIAAYLTELNSLLPIYSPLQEVRLREQFSLYWNSEKREFLLNGLGLEYRIENEWLPFQALSDGTRRVFFILSKLFVDAIMWGESLTPLSKIILLEEPELGIHPKQLQLLLQLIREVSKEHQVILTTHSPQTLDMLTAQELDRITICDYVPGKGTQMRKLSAAKRVKAKAYLRDEGFLSEFWRFSNLEDPD